MRTSTRLPARPASRSMRAVMAVRSNRCAGSSPSRCASAWIAWRAVSTSSRSLAVVVAGGASLRFVPATQETHDTKSAIRCRFLRTGNVPATASRDSNSSHLPPGDTVSFVYVHVGGAIRAVEPAASRSVGEAGDDQVSIAEIARPQHANIIALESMFASFAVALDRR